MPDARRVVLDTSALLVLRGNEPGADNVQELLEAAKRHRCRILLSFMTRMELLYVIGREEGSDAAQEALRLIDSFPVEWVGCDPDILTRAASLKARGNLSVADSWIAATAVTHAAALVHRDPEFHPLTDIPQERLPSR